MKTVILEDEHSQPVVLDKRKDGVYWKFKLLPGARFSGPFKTEAKAIADAEEYCGSAAGG